MSNPNHAKTYKEQETLSASPGALIVKLYERLLLDLHKAERHMASREPVEIAAKTECLIHANDIVLKLLEHVDTEQGGEIAEKLVPLYIFFSNEILEINRTLETPRLKRLQTMISQMRDAWKEVARKEIAG